MMQIKVGENTYQVDSFLYRQLLLAQKKLRMGHPFAAVLELEKALESVVILDSETELMLVQLPLLVHLIPVRGAGELPDKYVGDTEDPYFLYKKWILRRYWSELQKAKLVTTPEATQALNAYLETITQ